MVSAIIWRWKKWSSYFKKSSYSEDDIPDYWLFKKFDSLVFLVSMEMENLYWPLSKNEKKIATIL